MKYVKFFAVPLFALVLLAFAVSSANGVGKYTQLPTIIVPGDLAGGFDISWVDPVAGRYYLANRGTGTVAVVDAEQAKLLYSIGGFVGSKGSGKSGPDGVLTIGNELWAGDGDSTVKVADLTAGASATVFSINTGGTKRADELAYDPADHVILIANDRDATPFVTFISQTTRTILSTLPYPQATGGIEQPVWDAQQKKFYLALPATTNNPNGEVDELDPTTFKITKVFPMPCGPAGLVLLPGDRLMTSCGAVVDARNGNILAVVTNPSNGSAVGGDEIWYNSGDDRVYFGNNQVTVVDASTYDLIRMSGTAVHLGLQQAPIDTATYRVLTYLFGFSLPMDQAGNQVGVFGGHSIAANSANNYIFVPAGGVGIKVFAEN